VVGRRFPGMIPRASTLIARSATASSTTTHIGAEPASENGHNTRKPPEHGLPAGGFRPGHSAQLIRAAPH
jgi:hypothetical protein